MDVKDFLKLTLVEAREGEEGGGCGESSYQHSTWRSLKSSGSSEEKCLFEGPLVGQSSLPSYWSGTLLEV